MRTRVRACSAVFFYFMCILVLTAGNLAAGENRYVGSKACRECHEKEYLNYKKFSKKASSFESIKKMKSKLSPSEFKACFECHTTGYGKPGGFVSEKSTPDLKEVGCEVCHGPGSIHIESEDPEDIRLGSISIEDCTKCHNKSRVNEFGFKPLLFGGAH